MTTGLPNPRLPTIFPPRRGTEPMHRLLLAVFFTIIKRDRLEKSGFRLSFLTE